MPDLPLVIERKRRLRVLTTFAQFEALMILPHPLGLELPSAMPPREVRVAVAGSDVEGDGALLWMLTALLAPKVIVELGVRHGCTSRVLMAGAASNIEAAYLVDPNPLCAERLPPLPSWAHFVAAPGEHVWKNGAQKFERRIDLLFVDTDPHTYDQTREWLETYVSVGLAPGGVAIFHDVFAARQEIKVREAVEDWIRKGPHPLVGWDWHIYPSLPGRFRYGLGVLWKPL